MARPVGGITYLEMLLNRAIAQAVSYRLPTMVSGVDPSSKYVGFMVNKVAPGQVSLWYFDFLSTNCSTFINLLIINVMQSQC
jgi:hypothetical protein